MASLRVDETTDTKITESKRLIIHFGTDKVGDSLGVGPIPLGYTGVSKGDVVKIAVALLFEKLKEMQ